MISLPFQISTFLYMFAAVVLILIEVQSKPVANEELELNSTDRTAEILDLLNSKGFKGDSSQKVLSKSQNNSLLRCWFKSQLSTDARHSSPTTLNPLRIETSAGSSSTNRTSQFVVDRSTRDALRNKLSGTNGGTIGTASISSGLNPESCQDGMKYSALLKTCVAGTSGRGPGVG